MIFRRIFCRIANYFLQIFRQRRQGFIADQIELVIENMVGQGKIFLHFVEFLCLNGGQRVFLAIHGIGL